MFQALFKKSNYQKSKAIDAVDFTVCEEAVQITQKLVTTSHADIRQKLSEKLLDALADRACIDIVKVTIADKPQVHKKKQGRVVYKQYGFYRPDKKSIYITNLTAVRKKPLAGKTFCDTLLHEWMHHYDSVKLGLNSIHTAGFYARLRSLKVQLGLLD